MTPSRPPAELLAPLIRALCVALEAQTQSFIGRLARPLMGLILHRVVSISHRFRRFVERIEAGRPFPRPRTVSPPPPGAPPRRHTPDPLPRRFNWLEAVLPDIVPHRALLSCLLDTPEMAAAIAAAPAQMGRVLRPLCRMLGLKPPPSLNAPVRTDPPPGEPQMARAAEPTPPPQRPPAKPRRTWLPIPRAGAPPFPNLA